VARSWRWFWIAGLVALWLLRVPSLAQPMASDQGLYAYAGQRLLAGDAPYAGAWDQKPPGIHVVYAFLWSVWPDESVVAGADLVAAALAAWLLVVIGRRRFTESAGLSAAAVLLFFGNPALAQRVGGVFVRAQSETFIALAVTAALALLAVRHRLTRHLVGVGLLLGVAFWLKPNAAAYGLTTIAALFFWPNHSRGWSAQDVRRELVPVVATGAAMVILPLLLMAAAGSLTDLYLATIAYNAAYSGDTYDGVMGVVRYALSFPIARARNDALWFMGALGTLLIVAWWLRTPREPRTYHALVPIAWLGAAGISIVINGGRDLPQYFIQAAPALALAAGVGLTPVFALLRQRHVAIALAALVLIVYGAHRASGFGDLADNLRRDWGALTDRTDRRTYLTHFGGRPSDKYVASAVADLAALAKATTLPDDTIYVFGFSPGVPVLAERRSASRFHWSQPIVTEFAAGRPGYGSAGLLGELQRNAPTLVALQRDFWAPGGRHSSEFFHATPALETWLQANYRRDADIDRFEIWRRQ
jgi:hypothetical protein